MSLILRIFSVIFSLLRKMKKDTLSVTGFGSFFSYLYLYYLNDPLFQHVFYLVVGVVLMAALSPGASYYNLPLITNLKKLINEDASIGPTSFERPTYNFSLRTFFFRPSLFWGNVNRYRKDHQKISISFDVISRQLSKMKTLKAYGYVNPKVSTFYKNKDAVVSYFIDKTRRVPVWFSRFYFLNAGITDKLIEKKNTVVSIIDGHFSVFFYIVVGFAIMFLIYILYQSFLYMGRTFIELLQNTSSVNKSNTVSLRVAPTFTPFTLNFSDVIQLALYFKDQFRTGFLILVFIVLFDLVYFIANLILLHRLECNIHDNYRLLLTELYKVCGLPLDVGEAKDLLEGLLLGLCEQKSALEEILKGAAVVLLIAGIAVVIYIWFFKGEGDKDNVTGVSAGGGGGEGAAPGGAVGVGVDNFFSGDGTYGGTREDLMRFSNPGDAQPKVVDAFAEADAAAARKEAASKEALDKEVPPREALDKEVPPREAPQRRRWFRGWGAKDDAFAGVESTQRASVQQDSPRRGQYPAADIGAELPGAEQPGAEQPGSWQLGTEIFDPNLSAQEFQSRVDELPPEVRQTANKLIDSTRGKFYNKLQRIFDDPQMIQSVYLGAVNTLNMSQYLVLDVMDDGDFKHNIESFSQQLKAEAGKDEGGSASNSARGALVGGSFPTGLQDPSLATASQSTIDTTGLQGGSEEERQTMDLIRRLNNLRNNPPQGLTPSSTTLASDRRAAQIEEAILGPLRPGYQQQATALEDCPLPPGSSGEGSFLGSGGVGNVVTNPVQPFDLEKACLIPLPPGSSGEGSFWEREQNLSPKQPPESLVAPQQVVAQEPPVLTEQPGRPLDSLVEPIVQEQQPGRPQDSLQEPPVLEQPGRPQDDIEPKALVEQSERPLDALGEPSVEQQPGRPPDDIEPSAAPVMEQPGKDALDQPSTLPGSPACSDPHTTLSTPPALPQTITRNQSFITIVFFSPCLYQYNGKQQISLARVNKKSTHLLP